MSNIAISIAAQSGTRILFPSLKEEEETLENPNVCTAVKRSFETMSEHSTGSAKMERLTKFHRWEDPKSNALWELVKPQKVETCNPYAEVEIKVLTGKVADDQGQEQEQYKSFILPQSALRTLAPRYFEKIFSKSSTWKENLNRKMVWKGSEASPYIHPQAAAQVLLFAHIKAGIINQNDYRSLKQLKEEFPQEFNLILNDILVICERYDIIDLKTHSIEFVKQQIAENTDNISSYLSWALSASTEFNALEIWKAGLQLFSFSRQGQMTIFTVLLSVAESDYSDCTPSQKKEIFEMLKGLLTANIELWRANIWKMIPSSEYDQVTIEKFMEAICSTVLILYPRFDFPDEVIETITIKSNFVSSNSIPYNLVSFLCKIFSDVYGSRTEAKKYLASIKKEDKPEFREIKALILANMNAKSKPNKSIEDITSFLDKYPENFMALRRRVEDRSFVICENDDDVLKKFDASIADCKKCLEIAPNHSGALKRLREEIRTKEEFILKHGIEKK